MAGYLMLTLIAVVALGVSIWAIVDAASTSPEDFKAAGSSRKMWMVLLVFFTLAADVIGVILAIVYLALLRPRVRAVRAVPHS